MFGWRGWLCYKDFMQFQGKLNEVEVKEASKFIRPKGYKARMTVTYLRLAVYAGIVLFIVFESFFRHMHIPPVVIAVRVALLAFIVWLAWSRYQKGARETVARLDAGLPDTLELTADGVQLKGPNGAQGFQPWVSYSGFREGQHVVLLQRTEKDFYNVVPIAALGEAERSALRGLLTSHLPVLTK
jgi:hypothetical protein